ncbi:O-antigen ligase family protein [Terasakiella pusilla]|uniref:O-antigen ligase family protein n=1 Tax=Terasakiella pusilla TaxID=64973 RepID=UPI003AA9C12B
MLQKITFYGFLTTILLAPLPFGSNREWSWTTLALLIGLWVFLDTLPFNQQENKEKSQLKKLLFPALLFSLFCGWSFLQTVSLSPTPSLPHPLWQEAQSILNIQLPATISLNPQDTLQSLMIMLTYGGCFWLSCRVCHAPEKAKIVLNAFMVASALYAFYGLIVYFLDLKTILWFDKWAYKQDVTSTFVNRNTYATYAALGTLVSIAVLFQSIGKHLHDHLTPRQTIRILIENISQKAWFPFTAFLLNITALFQTHSRGGFLSLIIAMALLLACLAYIRLIPRKLLISFFAVVGFGAVFALSMSSDLTLKRLEGTSLASSARDDVYLATTEAIKSAPYIGTGYGTFQEGFKPFKSDSEMLSWYDWTEAHNTYLELAMETGIPATLLIISLFLLLFYINMRAVMKRRRRQIYAVVSAAAIVLVAAHAVVDFSLQIPGFTVSFLLIAGMGWAQSWTSKRRRRT